MSGYVYNLATGETTWRDSTPEELSAIHTPTPQETALAAIAALEFLQVTKLTARADREFRLAVFQALAALPGLSSLATHPAFLTLKATDDAIKAQRALL